MESTEYKKQYGEYLARAEEALNRARGTYLEMYVHSDKS